MSASKKWNTFICLMLVVLTVISIIFISASAVTEDIEIPEAQNWTDEYSAGTHKSGYSSASAECNSVYPKGGGIDLFSTIQCRAVNSSGTLIGVNGYEKLKEGEGPKEILLKQGMQGNISVCFQFRGNSSSGARAVVTYDATYISDT